jgi:hypothetical protein
VIKEIVEDKRFQIRTKSKIGGNNVIKWNMQGIGWFTFDTKNMVNAKNCPNSREVVGLDDPFFKRAGVLTFQKTTTQLKIWFDDMLEATWVYNDKSVSETCQMKNKLTGLKFKASHSDTVATHYRYETGEKTHF